LAFSLVLEDRFCSLLQGDMIKTARSLFVNILEDVMNAADVHVNGLNTSEGMTALMQAAKYGQITLLREQLRVAGIDVNARDEYEDTVLIVAARNGRTGIVQELLQAAGIDVNARRPLGKTALMHAAKNGKVEMVKDLLNVPGIDLDVIDKYGKSALMYAEEESHSELAHMLQNATRAKG
jgi:ankyrin repeat protein